MKLNTGSRMNKYVHNLTCVIFYTQSARKAYTTDNVGKKKV
jgi:hypothetical protein